MQLNISQDEVAPIVRPMLKVGGGAIIEHGWASSAGWETISLSLAGVVTKLHLGPALGQS
jgi:hypothetical protein